LYEKELAIKEKKKIIEAMKRIPLSDEPLIIHYLE